LLAVNGSLILETIHSGGTIGDFYGDGWQNVFVATGGGEPDHLCSNQGNGTFVDEAICGAMPSRTGERA
jgi:hypothetical protein